MRKLLLLIACLAMAVVSPAQTAETVTKDGTHCRVSFYSPNIVRVTKWAATAAEPKAKSLVVTMQPQSGLNITKKEAENMGWGSGVTLDEAAPGMSIGGSRFGNREGLLPEKKGRTYYECDIDYVRGGRNAKRIVYSNDGLIFYTDDHYNSFEQLY